MGLYRWFFICFILLTLFFLISDIAEAAFTLIKPNQSDIKDADDYSVSLEFSIEQADDTKYYLRGVFYKEGTSDYCGYTWNGSGWYKGPYTSGDGWKNFLPISIKNSTWSGILKSKIDTGDSGCRESGVYGFKIERFTESGSPNFDNQNEVRVNIMIPTPTHTPQPTHTPMPTDKPTPTVKPDPSATPTTVKVNSLMTNVITGIPSNTPRISPMVSKADKDQNHNDTKNSEVSVLGSMDDGIGTNASESGFTRSSGKYLAIALSFIGLGFAILTGVSVWRIADKKRQSII